MEIQLMEDLSYWDPIGDLQEAVGDYLLTVPDNWENELGLGPIKNHVDVLEEGSPESTAKDPIFDIPDAFLHEWMEEKIYVGNLEPGDSFFEDVESILDNIDQENEDKLQHSFDSNSSVTEKDTAENLTPPDSPKNSSNVPDENANSNTSGSEVFNSMLEIITPPDTPPSESTLTKSDTSLLSISSPSSPVHCSKPYGRRQKHSKKLSTVETKVVVCSEVKKVRKRDQNRDAATRYRMKKKAEAEKLGTIESALELKNKALKDKVDSISSEISYLKGLMKEVILAKSKLPVLYVKCSH